MLIHKDKAQEQRTNNSKDKCVLIDHVCIKTVKEKKKSAIPPLKSWGTFSGEVNLQLHRKKSRKVTRLDCHDKAANYN